MQELIKINSETQTVSARDLYEFLSPTERFSQWMHRQFQYGFDENVDYTGCEVFNTRANQNLQDYFLTLDCAKEISMLQKSKKGKEARTYFIQCEKKLKEIATPKLPTTYLEALKALVVVEEEKESLRVENQIQNQRLLEYEPKIQYVDRILQSTDLLTITQIAKDYGISGQRMNNILHMENVQFKQSGQWLLYAKHADKGFTKSTTVKITHTDGRDGSKLNTKWTQKGRLFIHGILDNIGIKAKGDE